MTLPKAAVLAAEQSVQASIAQADAVVSLLDAEGEAARAELLEVLRAADKRVAVRLALITPKANGEMRFSAAQAISYRTQIAMVIRSVEGKVGQIATGAATSAVDKSAKAGANLLAKLEKDFHGVTVSPSIMAGMQASQTLRGPKAALVTSIATSVDRYGLEMGRQFSRVIQEGLIAGDTNEAMVARLVAHGGPKGKVSLAARVDAKGIVQRIREGDIPEGLFVRHKFWAERIVRTEVAKAYSSSRLASLYKLREDDPSVRKKIVAVFDTRTAPDSIAVHGQIRVLEDPFMDGAGRVYQHPPGRPNDRETIIPWLGEWEETPSTEPPSEAEQARAEALANPPVTAEEPTLPPPATAEELERLKAAAAQAERRAQADSDAERATIELEQDRQTRAAALLLEHEREKIKKAQDLVTKIEQAKALALEQANELKLNKIDKVIAAHVKGPTPHLGTLELYKLAGTDPEGFALIVNGMRDVPLPIEAITGGIKVSHQVLDSLVKDTIGTYGQYAEKGKAAIEGALGTWKTTPGFTGWLEELAAKKDAKSKRLYAALIHSEQELFISGESQAISWEQSLKLTKKPSALITIKSKYAPAKEPYLLASGGGDFVDLFDPVSKQKLGWFKHVGQSYEVTPPANLGAAFVKRSFPDQQAAAAYAHEVSDALKKAKIAAGLPIAEGTLYPGTPFVPPAAAPLPGLKPTPKKINTSTTSRFNQKAKPGTELGPLVVSAQVKKQIEEARQKTRDHLARQGLTKQLKQGHNTVDQLLDQSGLDRHQRAWSGDPSGCWYGSSAGPKAYMGRFVVREADSHHKDALAVCEQLRTDGQNIEVSDHAAREFVRYAREKYAATQETLEHRIKSGDLAQHVDKDGYVTLFRGIDGLQAKQARQDRTEGKQAPVDMRSVQSWSVKREAAERFALGEHGVVLTARVHYTRIFSQYEAERIAMRRFGDGESEWIVIADKEEFLFDSEDITNREPE